MWACACARAVFERQAGRSTSAVTSLGYKTNTWWLTMLCFSWRSLPLRLTNVHLLAPAQHGGTVPLFIDGKFVQSKSTRLIDVTNPVSAEHIVQFLSPPRPRDLKSQEERNGPKYCHFCFSFGLARPLKKSSRVSLKPLQKRWTPPWSEPKRTRLLRRQGC